MNTCMPDTSDTSWPAGFDPTSSSSSQSNSGNPDFPILSADVGVGLCSPSTPVIQAIAGQSGIKLTLVVRDNTGMSLAIPDGVVVTYTVKESYSSDPIGTETATIEDATRGIVSVTLGSDYTNPGLYISELVSKSADGNTLYTTSPYWLFVRASMGVTKAGPPTIAEIRMILADNCPDKNILLDKKYEFTDEEIAFAISRPIDEFNGTYIPETRYTPTSFPTKWKFHWSNAAAGYLLKASAIAYARNTIPYRSGDVSMDETRKLAIYTQLGEDLLKQWREFIRIKKYELNTSRGWLFVR